MVCREKPTSHSPHREPSPSNHSQNKVLHFLSAVNIRAKLKKKKVPFVLEKSIMDSKERDGNCRAEAGEQYISHLGMPTFPSPEKEHSIKKKKKRKRFLASWPLQATILPSEVGRWVRVCTCKRRPSILGVSDTQGSSNS